MKLWFINKVLCRLGIHIAIHWDILSVINKDGIRVNTYACWRCDYCTRRISKRR